MFSKRKYCNSTKKRDAAEPLLMESNALSSRVVLGVAPQEFYLPSNPVFVLKLAAEIQFQIKVEIEVKIIAPVTITCSESAMHLMC